VEQVGFDLVPAAAPLNTGRTLAELEAVIEHGQRAFIDVGLAVLEIRDRRLFLEAGHADLDAYCRTRWGWGRTNAENYITAARVALDCQTFDNPPANLGQAMALASLPAAERREVAATTDFAATSVRAVQELVRERKEAKPHAEAHAERLAAYEARVEERAEAPAVELLPFDRIAYGTNALGYLLGLPEASADVCVTSPPYWAKRTYVPGAPLELGQEPTPELYVDALCEIVGEIGRVLTPEGCLFLNLGDTLGSQPGQYRGDPERRRGISDQAIRANGSAVADRQLDVAEKSFCLIPERVMLRLVLQLGWRLAGKVVWHKVGHQPENVFDRLTQAWEPVYVLTRSRHAYFKRGDERTDVWAIPVGRGGEAAGHLAPFPEALVERAIRHACPDGGTVLDPFAGSGTTLTVARRMGRRFLGCDLATDPAE
jgi:DNA modification methylase